MTLEHIKKLMGWCPKKDSLRKGRQEDFFSDFKSENESLQLMPYPAGLQEGKVLKAQAMYKGLGIAKILFSMLVVLLLPIVISLFGFGFSPSPTGPDHNVVIFDPNLSLILDIYLTLILYLALLAIILYNRTTVMLTHEKIIIRRHLFKSLVLQKEDIVQISVSKNKGHSYRWPLRLLILVTLAIRLTQIVESTTGVLRESAPVSSKLSLVLVEFWGIAFVLVIFYIIELLTPYQQILKITTHSNLNLEFYVDEPEEIIGILKKE
jgi:Protein of unknown function (DUF1673)